MDFESERTAITAISEAIVRGGVTLYNTIKYVYAIAEEDFYHCNVRDVLKVALNNVTDANALSSLGMRISSGKCPEMNTPEYNRVLALIVYSFAVRIPALKTVKVNGQTLSDLQLKSIYEMVINKGASNYNEAIGEDYDQNRKLIAKGRQLPDYDATWYKAYILTHVPALAGITNKNIFLLGFVDILFTLFYACLEERIAALIEEFAI